MSFSLGRCQVDKPIQFRKIGVVGSGQIGPDIALHFAKALASRDVPVVVVDVSPEALQRGRARVDQKIAKGRESGAFTPEAAERLGRLLSFTGDYEALRGADLVIEAATENLDVKRRIFAQLEALCGPGAILASNSSHIEPDDTLRGSRCPVPRPRHPLLLPGRPQPARRDRSGDRDRSGARRRADGALRGDRQGAREGARALRLRRQPGLRGALPRRRARGRGRAGDGQGGRCRRARRARAWRRPVHRDEPHRRQPDHQPRAR